MTSASIIVRHNFYRFLGEPGVIFKAFGMIPSDFVSRQLKSAICIFLVIAVSECAFVFRGHGVRIFSLITTSGYSTYKLN